MTYTIQSENQTLTVSRKEAVYMASIIWDISEEEANKKISVLEKLPSISSIQSLKIA